MNSLTVFSARLSSQHTYVLLSTSQNILTASELTRYDFFFFFLQQTCLCTLSKQGLNCFHFMYMMLPPVIPAVHFFSTNALKTGLFRIFLHSVYVVISIH